MPASLLALGVATTILFAQDRTEPIDPETNARIRQEGMERSQILRTMHYLTDVYGPRLTGSPSHANAAKWAVGQMESWGLVNGRLEPFDFGRIGWMNERATGHILAPVNDNLVFEVLGWTPSTAGTVTGEAVHVVPPTGPPGPGEGGRGSAPLGPTEAEMDAFLQAIGPKVRNAIVLVGAHVNVPFREEPQAARRDEAELQRLYNPDPDAAGRGGRGGGRGGRGGRGDAPPEAPRRLSPLDVSRRVTDFLIASGVRLRLIDAGREHGLIQAFAVVSYDPGQTLPTAVLRNEDYGRIVRLLEHGETVTLEFAIQNRTFPEGRTSYNAIAEIPGTDKADEIVMLGGHLDSWHAGTGATDNAIGCAVMMEAVRILKAIGARPRRTIRVALWAGEEQGLLGSRAYVSQHFGSVENPEPDFARLSGYFNLDSGTGRIRGATIFGPPEAAGVLRQILAPFQDLGVVGVAATSSRRGGGTDSGAFSSAGLPGINFLQDPIEYESHTWHSNVDTLERVVEDDAKKAAIVVASAVYHVAMRDERLPRF
jgi:hypothetical protein